MIAPAKPPLLAMVDELLAEQQSLQTPVARFSGRLDAATPERPALNPVYRDLIPLSAPGPGEQYAFEVDLDACSGCKSCVAACHALNGLDETESWRDVGLIVGGSAEQPYQQTITSACHHCADPGCLNGCPVLAYDKDPVTGIVRHLDDQCIGCSYCVLKCPYDVPKYNARLGIVRKCDLCHGRLAAGEAPACVQSCPTRAIRIVHVAVDRTGPRPAADTSAFLAAAPDPASTGPTTRYVSQRGIPANARAADAGLPRIQPAHTPLAVLLTATQAAWGASLTLPWAHAWTGPVAIALAVVGLGASVAHLGRPARAWRIFLGLRRSWLSREAVLFGLWLPVLLLAVLPPPGLPMALGWLPVAALVGGAAVFCSAMIYIDTPRRFWRAHATAVRMGGTAAAAALIGPWPLAAGAALLAKLAFEFHQRAAATPSGYLLRHPLRRAFQVRTILTVASLPFIVTYYVTTDPLHLAVGGGLALAGELSERILFFRAVDPAKMPGGVAA